MKMNKSVQFNGDEGRAVWDRWVQLLAHGEDSPNGATD